MAGQGKSSEGTIRGNHRPGFGERIGEIQSSAQHLFTEAKGAVTDVREALDLKARVERHPYGMLGAAAAIGYVLGGGLFTPLTTSILRLGLRLAAIPLVKDELALFAQGMIEGFGSKDETRKHGAGSASKS